MYENLKTYPIDCQERKMLSVSAVRKIKAESNMTAMMSLGLAHTLNEVRGWSSLVQVGYSFKGTALYWYVQCICNTSY